MVRRGFVTRVSGTQVFVVVPMASEWELGPVPWVGGPYAPGDVVLVGMMEGRPDSPAILGRLTLP